VVTGAGDGVGGIGKVIAYRLAREGVRVLGVVRDPAEITPELLAGPGSGPPLAMIAVDLTDDRAPDLVMQAVRETLDGRVDILVNNAAAAGSVRAHELDMSHWRDIFALNVDGAFRLTQAVLPVMMGAGYGRIVNISSVNGISGFRGSSDYAISKAAIGAMSRSLAADYGEYGITSNTVSPGVIMTALGQEYVFAREQWYIRQSLDIKPIERWGQPEDVAAAVAFLASDEAGYVTAQELAVDGGLTGTHFVPDRFTGEHESGS